MKSLVTLALNGIGYINPDEHYIRFCEGRDGHTDTDCPIILELYQIGGLSLPNLVALDIEGCHGVNNKFIESILSQSPGESLCRTQTILSNLQSNALTV